ncbi:MAG: HAD family phosphatase [Sulfurimonas sp.]|nr:HAD family phosphatase [Sulfurimonas sp.]MBU3938572.1 HAD family phosphatase [bacterium]MBU4024639.1 HAD family phosphatase [bacterium]MBU4059592.1 HAD family phosphatase [bacterium]MBU4109580.1 HAD family phosphatase [bacterium]
MKKYLLFDNDGVLVETEKWYHRANVEILELLGLQISEERYKEIMIQGQSALLLASEHGYDAESVEKYRDKRNELYQHYIRTEDIEIQGVSEIIKELKESYQMGIVTSARRADFELIHSKRSIAKHMKFVLCSGEYKRSKPHADPYLEALARFNGAKTEALIIEDSGRGLASALNAEIDCAIVYNEFTVSHDFTGATHRINSLGELKKLLEKINS